ncbi:uncharacterized protein LOC134204659 [Armigeres subalbatus]|uniref:uncharacterized protein LOC134204659 n=1 Tax=Armigeres subalbatus TaxID=124917 RepID=UPI002ED13B98
MITLSEQNFDFYSNSEEVDAEMSQTSVVPTLGPLLHTYGRRRSIEQLLQDWETVPSVSDINVDDNTIKIVRIESLNENANPLCASSPGVVVMDAQSGCSCGKSDEVEKHKASMESLRRERDALLLENAQLKAQYTRLLDSLTSKLLPRPEKPFYEEEEEFLDCEVLIRLSHEAGDSDYLFLKFLMMKLFPDGLVGRSVTGRPSNNPPGRPKKSDMGSSENMPSMNHEVNRETGKIQLDPVKVKWIKRRLNERRIFLRDDAVAANVCYKGVGHLMTRVIANASR